MQLRERLIRTVAQLERWPTVDLTPHRGKLTQELKRHIIEQNCREIGGRLKGFILIHEDGRVEHFGHWKAKQESGKSGGAIRKASPAFFNFFHRHLEEDMALALA